MFTLLLNNKEVFKCETYEEALTKRLEIINEAFERNSDVRIANAQNIKNDKNEYLSLYLDSGYSFVIVDDDVGKKYEFTVEEYQTILALVDDGKMIVVGFVYMPVEDL